MKPFTRFASLCLLSAAGLVSTLSAQTANVTGGNLQLSLSSAFVYNLASQGVNVTYSGYGDNQPGYTVTGGTLELKSGIGRAESVGIMTFSSEDVTVQLSSLALDTTAALPYLTADVTVNGEFYGRYPVFEITNGNPYVLPLDYGEVKTPVNAYFRPNPIFHDDFYSFFQLTDFDYSQVIGATSVDVTAAPQS